MVEKLMQKLVLKMRDFELQALKSLRSLPLLSVRVNNASGKDSTVNVSIKDRVATVKDKALGGEFHKDSSSYKLVLAKNHRILDDGKTLEEEGIQEDDELVLLKRRHNANHEGEAQKRVPFKVPDIAAIQRLTLKLEARKKEEPVAAAATGLHIDFNTELRRILISLIDSSLLLQSVDECEDGNCRGMMSPVLAMEWLLQHEGEPEQEEPAPPTDQFSRTRRKRREFTANVRAVENLKEMGFQEEDILVALKVTGNSQEAACDWLLGDKKGSIENIDEGLDEDSPMYKAIMENPMVQLSLYNPRVLGAFEDMLESPANSAMYISDPETGPVLLQISRIVQGFAR
ncbi:hypothetical protein QZH41_009533 [Actinostola sp. cb2023]|nr:hypothetical protein QZH41_009533 [Actinostola sp. cb2023]